MGSMRPAMSRVRVSNGAHAIPPLVRRPLNVAQESILAFGFMARVSPKARNS